MKEARYWGSVLEAAVADRYAQETGYKIQRANQLIRSKDHDFMIANIDRKVVGEALRIGTEIKTAAGPWGWGESFTDEIPPAYMLQCQHYLAVTGYDFWDLAVLIGNRDYRQYRIAPIEEIKEQLIAAEMEFWDRVQVGMAPEPNWQSEATTRLFKALYPGTNGHVVKLPPLAQKYQDVMDDASHQRGIYDKVIVGCKNRIAAIMGPNAVGILDDGSVIIRKEQTRKAYEVPEKTFMVSRRTSRIPVEAQKKIDSGEIWSAAMPEFTPKEIEHDESD